VFDKGGKRATFLLLFDISRDNLCSSKPECRPFVHRADMSLLLLHLNRLLLLRHARLPPVIHTRLLILLICANFIPRKDISRVCLQKFVWVFFNDYFEQLLLQPPYPCRNNFTILSLQVVPSLTLLITALSWLPGEKHGYRDPAATV